MMSSKRRISRCSYPFIFVAALLIGLTTTAFPQERSSNRVDPVIYLGTEHGGVVVHDRALPLLLRVRLANPVASNIQMQNARIEAEAKDAGKPAPPSESSSSSPLPSLTLSSSANPLPLSFDVRDATGAQVNVAVRSLRATELPAALVLDGSVNPQFYYGIDETELGNRAPGKYFIRAVLSRKSAAPGEWSGETQSTPLAFDLRSGNLAPAERLVDVQQAGRFYLHDRNYPMVEKQASNLLELDKLSVSAWELRGDVLMEQGKLDDAEKAFKEALHNVQQHSDSVSPPLREPPEWLYQRLNKIRELRKAAQSR